ncbi:hypothetical protein JAK24_15505 [Stenotrophomonas maltophilia]|nr:hypothetical protein [Stenotrophomonas maltophilia]
MDLYLIAYAWIPSIDVDSQQRGVTPFERVEISHLLEFPKPIQQNDRITAAIIAAACTGNFFSLATPYFTQDDFNACLACADPTLADTS